MEHPLTRHPPGEVRSYSGRVDYWLSYRGLAYVIESKHSYFAYGRPSSPSQSIPNRFNRSVRQLRGIRKRESEYLIGEERALMKIAFQTIVFYEGSQSADSTMDTDFEEVFKEMLRKTRLTRKTDLQGLWLLHERLRKQKYDGGYWI